MKNSIKKALELIKSNEQIIIPTDTVYGLVCHYDSKSTVEKIYKLKKRSRKKPLILLGYDWKALKRFVRVGAGLIAPLRKQWPGPLTVVLPASKHVPGFLNKGFKTIGIRVPGNKRLRALLKQCPGKVLASTSANISGEKDVNKIAKKVKLFLKAKKGEMSGKPSKIIEIKNGNVKKLR